MKIHFSECNLSARLKTSLFRELKRVQNESICVKQSVHVFTFHPDTVFSITRIFLLHLLKIKNCTNAITKVSNQPDIFRSYLGGEGEYYYPKFKKQTHHKVSGGSRNWISDCKALVSNVLL